MFFGYFGKMNCFSLFRFCFLRVILIECRLSEDFFSDIKSFFSLGNSFGMCLNRLLSFVEKVEMGNSLQLNVKTPFPLSASRVFLVLSLENSHGLNEW